MTTTSISSVDQRVDYVINHHPHLKREKVHFTTKQGHVTLSGNVNSYFEKQMAQEAVRNIEGVEFVENELQVQWS